MAGEEGFEVHEREGVGSDVEDLHAPQVLSWCTASVVGWRWWLGTYLRGYGELAEFD